MKKVVSFPKSHLRLPPTPNSMYPTRHILRVPGVGSYSRRLTPSFTPSRHLSVYPSTRSAGFSRRSPYNTESYLPLLPLARLYSTNPPSSDAASKEVAKTADTSKEVVKPNTPLWEKVKKEAKHYWHGTKLLGQEVKISSKLQWKVLNGGTLTRREQRQVRAVPFFLGLLPIVTKRLAGCVYVSFRTFQTFHSLNERRPIFSG